MPIVVITIKFVLNFPEFGFTESNNTDPSRGRKTINKLDKTILAFQSPYIIYIYTVFASIQNNN